VPALVSQASLIPHRGEGGSASAGEGDTDTPMPGGMEPGSLTWDMGIHTTIGATLHPMDIHMDIHELHSCQNEIGVTQTS